MNRYRLDHLFRLIEIQKQIQYCNYNSKRSVYFVLKWETEDSRVRFLCRLRCLYIFFATARVQIFLFQDGEREFAHLDAE
jgi:hypothetical protein